MSDHNDLVAIGGAERPVVQGSETEAPKPDGWAYCLHLTIGGEHRWTSLHTTAEGARARLEEKVDEYGVREAYEAQRAAESSGETSAAAVGQLVYGVDHLPLETP